VTVTTHTGGSILGHAVKRTEDQELITGAGLYTGDLPVEGSLHAIFVRSPIAHGTLGAIDVDEAKGMPGVVAVYTATDLDMPDRPGLPGVVPDAMSRPHLAKGKVRFVGDIVAVVIATTAGEALDASETVFPDIDPLPAVTGIEEAFAQDAPLLFDEVGSNLVAGAGTGDVEGIFDSADVVVEGKFLNQRLAGVPMEPNACVAEPGEPEGGVTVWLSTQTPHGARDAIAGDLGLDGEQVRVIAPRVGGGFGPKATAYPEYTIAAKAAMVLGRPVRWNETRSENMLSMVHGRSQVQWVELGVKRDGTIVGTPGRTRPSARSCRASPSSWPRASTTSRPSTSPGRASPPTRRRAAPTAAPGAPRRRSCSSASWTWPRTSWAWTRSSSAARTSCSPSSTR